MTVTDVNIFNDQNNIESTRSLRLSFMTNRDSFHCYFDLSRSSLFLVLGTVGLTECKEPEDLYQDYNSPQPPLFMLKSIVKFETLLRLIFFQFSTSRL